MLALAAAEAAPPEGAGFRRSRSGTIYQGEEEGQADPDLGLDPSDTEGRAWRDRDWAEAMLEAASTRAWANTAEAWA